MRRRLPVVEALTGWEGTDRGPWLDDRLRRVLASEPGRTTVPRPWQRGARSGASAARANGAGGGARRDARRARPHAPLRAVAGPAQRVANLDALRAAIADVRGERRAGSARPRRSPGCSGYFDALRSPTLQDKEMLAADAQHVLGAGGAVVVSTYHKAKGSNGRSSSSPKKARSEGAAPDARFEVAPESSAEGFGPRAPALEGRSIRYWPWPLGQTDERAPRRGGRAIGRRTTRGRTRGSWSAFAFSTSASRGRAIISSWGCRSRGTGRRRSTG